ncbi:MAG: hypothetical protein COB24_13580 [Hyphomicrobiales bacterium]|nr:MAG: hypothetical protein COB24_13580 [Hyphomicrobiales bacterium]
MQNSEGNDENTDWRLIYVMAVIAAFGSIAFMPIQTVFFIIWPLPTDVEAWFEVFAQNPIRGMISLDLLFMLQIIFVALIYLGLAVVLWLENKALILLAMVSGFMGLALYFASNPSFEMLNLSGQYAATSDIDVRNQLLAAGHGAMAIFTGTAYVVYYMLNAIALLLFAFAMYGSAHFSRMNAHSGMMAGLLMTVPASFGIVGMSMAFLSLIPWGVFCFLYAGAFMRMVNRK